MSDEPMLFESANGDTSDEGTPEFHWVDDVLYLCHEGAHFCAEANES